MFLYQVWYHAMLQPYMNRKKFSSKKTPLQSFHSFCLIFLQNFTAGLPERNQHRHTMLNTSQRTAYSQFSRFLFLACQ